MSSTITAETSFHLQRAATAYGEVKPTPRGGNVQGFASTYLGVELPDDIWTIITADSAGVVVYADRDSQLGKQLVSAEVIFKSEGPAEIAALEEGEEVERLTPSLRKLTNEEALSLITDMTEIIAQEN